MILILSPFQGFSSRETDFYFYQFPSNLFKYLFSNLPLSHPYNISFFLKSLSSAIFSFSYLLTSAFTLSSNSATISFVFSRSSSLFQLLFSAVNLFHHTKYFTTPPHFSIFSTSHSSTPSTSTGFTSSTFCLYTCSLYHTT